MRFDGDIIITDPCYIINKKNDDRWDENGFFAGPSWWDFVSKTTKTQVIGEDGKSWTRYNMPKHEDYPDARPKTQDDYDSKYEFIIDARRKQPVMFSPTLKAEWEAYHKAEDEWNSRDHCDWDRCECGENMEVLGLKTYLTSDTGYGDWSCHTFNSNTKQPIGEFCADAGMVGVFLLDEVLAYNPDFDYHINRTWTTTLIKDFHGEVEIIRTELGVQVKGTGNINFITGQTGF